MSGITIGCISKKVLKTIKQKKCRVLFLEHDYRIAKAISYLNKKRIAKALMLNDLDINKEEFVEWYYKHRLKKYPEYRFQNARQEALKLSYLGAIAVAKGFADSMISGVKQETKPFLAAVRVVGVKKNWSKASSYFLMERKDKSFLFADCGFQINPSASELAEIALQTAESGERLGLQPRVALLSYSTHKSGHGTCVEKVQQATLIAQRNSRRFVIDGELQADVAISKKAAEHKKGPELIHGNANILIFPNLEAGNIAYKLVERLAGYTATGPILQGLNNPISDLSRACSWQDIVRSAIILCAEVEK